MGRGRGGKKSDHSSVLPVSVLCGCSAVDSRRIKYTETVVETNLVSVLFVLGLFCWGFLVLFSGNQFSKAIAAAQALRERCSSEQELVRTPVCVSPVLLSLNPVTAGCRGRAKYLFYTLFFFFWKSWFHCLADLIDRIKSLIIFFFSSSECHFSTRIKMHLSQQSLPQLAARAGHRLPESRRCRSRGAAWEGCEGVVASGSSALALCVLSFPSKLISRCR